jgi:hypothetical protein
MHNLFDLFNPRISEVTTFSILIFIHFFNFYRPRIPIRPRMLRIAIFVENTRIIFWLDMMRIWLEMGGILWDTGRMISRPYGGPHQKPLDPLFVDSKLVLQNGRDKKQISKLYGNEIITKKSSAANNLCIMFRNTSKTILPNGILINSMGNKNVFSYYTHPIPLSPTLNHPQPPLNNRIKTRLFIGISHIYFNLNRYSKLKVLTFRVNSLAC